MLKRLLVMTIAVWMLTACTGKDAKKQESAFIIMKSEKIKFADMGFIYDSPSLLNVEVYAAGQPLVDLEINSENICLSLLKCMDKKDFNQEILVTEYPVTLLENIFRAKPIFYEKNLKTIEGGFEQKIIKEGVYDISYSVVSGNRVFRDTMNKIVIKVRKQ